MKALVEHIQLNYSDWFVYCGSENLSVYYGTAQNSC